MIDEGDDLYDDLYEDIDDSLLYKTPFQSLHENDTREEEFKKKEGELNGKVESLLKEVEALQQDKVVLTRNISCLFKTAQMELARKDKQMKELRDENLRLKLGGTRGPTNIRSHLPKAVVPADKTNVEMDSSEQGNRSRLEGAMGVSAKIHEPDTDGHKQISDEGKKGRGSSRDCSNQHKDRIPDSSRRTADDSSNRQKSSSVNNSGSDRRREYGHAEHRSRDRSRDHRDRDHRDRDHRDSGELRNSDSRKRHRS